MMKILHLTLKRRWFDMVKSGEKQQEYREIKPYWRRRLMNPGKQFTPKHFDIVKFKNGYAKNAPEITVELKEIFIGPGNVEWGAWPSEIYYVLVLGKVIDHND